jgi:hypothetical protein
VPRASADLRHAQFRSSRQLVENEGVEGLAGKCREYVDEYCDEMDQALGLSNSEVEQCKAGILDHDGDGFAETFNALNNLIDLDLDGDGNAEYVNFDDEDHPYIDNGAGGGDADLADCTVHVCDDSKNPFDCEDDGACAATVNDISTCICSQRQAVCTPCNKKSESNPIGCNVPRFVYPTEESTYRVPQQDMPQSGNYQLNFEVVYLTAQGAPVPEDSQFDVSDGDATYQIKTSPGVWSTPVAFTAGEAIPDPSPIPPLGTTGQYWERVFRRSRTG